MGTASRTAKATEAHRLATARRAATDPAKLAKAVRVVRVALALQLVAMADLVAEPAPPPPG